MGQARQPSAKCSHKRWDSPSTTSTNTSKTDFIGQFRRFSPNQAKADSEIWNDACSMKWQNLKMSSSHAEEAHHASSTTWTT